jgi:hypothetical protein
LRVERIAFSESLPAPQGELRSNARYEPLPEAGAQRTLEAVGSIPLLGASAAMPPHMWQEQGQPTRFWLFSRWRLWGVVTVPALVPRARL